MQLLCPDHSYPSHHPEMSFSGDFFFQNKNKPVLKNATAPPKSSAVRGWFFLCSHVCGGETPKDSCSHCSRHRALLTPPGGSHRTLKPRMGHLKSPHRLHQYLISKVTHTGCLGAPGKLVSFNQSAVEAEINSI